MQKFSNSLVCEHRHWVLWWHAKSACTALKVWYLRQYGYTLNCVNGQWQADGGAVHHRVSEWHNRFDPARHRDYFHFTVIRHPLARFVSHYDQQMASGDEGRTLEEYVYDTIRTDDERADPHLINQSHCLWDIPMNATLKLETVNEHWPKLMRLLRMPEKPLEVLNARGAGDKWEETLSDHGLRMLLTTYYADDLRLHDNAS